MIKITIELSDDDGYTNSCTVTATDVNNDTALLYVPFVDAIRRSLLGLGFTNNVVNKLIITLDEAEDV